MRWFRSRARAGSCLALLALALQLVLSFGHVHADRFAQPTAASASHAIVASSAGAPANSPYPDGLADDFCEICALINLAGTLLPSAAPALPVPIIVGRTPTDLAVAFAPTASQRAPFQARAPPLA